jgi:hypothetical protein
MNHSSWDPTSAGAARAEAEAGGGRLRSATAAATPKKGSRSTSDRPRVASGSPRPPPAPAVPSTKGSAWLVDVVGRQRLLSQPNPSNHIDHVAYLASMIASSACSAARTICLRSPASLSLAALLSGVHWIEDRDRFGLLPQ